jgi:signal transduction histidine kinase
VPESLKVFNLRKFLKRHTLWLGFLAVVAPLVVLLVLQYGWLAKLEKTSALAETAWLNNYLEAVATEIEYFYRSNGERALNLPPSLFTQDEIEKASYYCKKKPIKGARRIFVYDFFHRGGKPRLLLFDPSNCTMIESASSSEVRAIVVACAPWLLLGRKGGAIESVTLSVDERDLQNRLLLNPITDEASTVVGVAGIILDENYFKKILFPKFIKKSLPKFFSEESLADMIVTVRDGNDNLVIAPRKIKGGDSGVTRSVPFVFTDWTIGIRSKHLTPEEWARTNFAVNMTLSVLLAVGLMGGLVLAFRVASRAMRLSRMKTEFVSNVSHELRTPLASIRVFGEFLRLGRIQNPSKTREYGEYIETESRRLTQLINNILDFSRIDSGQKTYRFELEDVTEVVEESLKTFEVRLRHTGFEIDFEAPLTPVPAKIDREALAQAFCNLMDNAVKYSGDARRIVVRIARDDSFVTVSVTDFGIGISKDEQKKIFERFHRVGTGLVHDIKGSGLGLSIVNHIVTAHRGKISVDSEPGRGSSFSLYLPAYGETGAPDPEASFPADVREGAGV